MSDSNYLEGKYLIHCCKDRTLTYRTKEQPIFNGVAIPVYSVDTQQEAEDLIILTCRKQYKEHPLMRGKPWFKITLDGALDFKPYLDYEDLDAVKAKLKNSHEILKSRRSS